MMSLMTNQQRITEAKAILRGGDSVGARRACDELLSSAELVTLELTRLGKLYEEMSEVDIALQLYAKASASSEGCAAADALLVGSSFDEETRRGRSSTSKRPCD